MLLFFETYFFCVTSSAESSGETRRTSCYCLYLFLCCSSAILRYCSCCSTGYLCAAVKVRPHYAAQHTAAKCGKATRQKLRHATSICGRCVCLASACRSMLRGIKIRSANCWSHQKKPRGIWWVRGFKVVSALLRKKSNQVRRSRSTVLVTWRRSAKNYFFMWTRSHWRHMPSNFYRAANLQCVAFCCAA